MTAYQFMILTVLRTLRVEQCSLKQEAQAFTLVISMFASIFTTIWYAKTVEKVDIPTP